MGGGLLQLVAYGAQDAYITGNPQITFWKGLYKRHTNFAMEPFRVNFSGQAQWGTKQTAIIGRHADLLYSTYLEVVLPQDTAGSSPVDYYWNNERGALGFNLIRWIELDIGGQIIDRLYGEWLFLWSTLSKPIDQRIKLTGLLSEPCLNEGATRLINEPGCGTTGRQRKPNILYIPLEFFFTKNPGAALPLIALQYHEVKINIYWNEPELIAGNFTNSAANISVGGEVVSAPSISLLPSALQAAIYIDYIYLDTEERRRMAQASHEYLIEQVQFNEEKGIVGANNRIDLTFNHPVKELVWVVQPSYYRDCRLMAAQIALTTGTQRVFTNLLADTTANGGIGARFTISYSQGNSVYTVTMTDSGTSGYTLGAPASVLTFNGANIGGATPANNLVITVTSVSAGIITGFSFTGTPAGPTPINNTRLTPFTFDADPVYEQWIQINGQDRLDKRYGNYYSRVQAYQHHSGVSPGGGVYSYSFALKPEENQPSGTCNFSRIDTGTIVMNFGDNAINKTTDDLNWDVRVYAVNYNILRVMSGMAGLAYSN
jgi:hypothetical protein